MRSYILIVVAAIVGSGCFTLPSVTRNGQALTTQETTAELHSCYGQVAAGADFEHHWSELHDDLARRWVGCLKARGIRMQGGDQAITIGPGATHEEMQKDHDACLVMRPSTNELTAHTARPGVRTDTTQRPSYGDEDYRGAEFDTVLDEDCFGRKGYITASVTMLAELSPD